jgi:thioredoxin-related protein
MFLIFNKLVKALLKTFNYILFALVLYSVQSCAQQEKPHVDNVIHWMSITDAYKQSVQDSVKKKVYIDVYTQWCGWCKRMDASTFEDPSVIKYMNDHYYPVKLDAEVKDTIVLGDKVFVYKPEYRANEVAVALLNQKMSYPTSIYLDERFNMLTPVAGYQSTEQIVPVLRYFAEDIYKRVKWEDFEKQGYHE